MKNSRRIKVASLQTELRGWIDYKKRNGNSPIVDDTIKSMTKRISEGKVQATRALDWWSMATEELRKELSINLFRKPLINRAKSWQITEMYLFHHNINNN